MFITSKNKYLSKYMKIFGTCSIPLREARVECYIGETYVWSPCFADDQVLLTLFQCVSRRS